MSDFDRNATRWGQPYARAGRAEIDLGLRSYMLGVYNNMVIGLALTAILAHAAKVNAWWLLPIVAFAALAWSLHRATGLRK